MIYCFHQPGFFYIYFLLLSLMHYFTPLSIRGKTETCQGLYAVGKKYLSLPKRNFVAAHRRFYWFCLAVDLTRILYFLITCNQSGLWSSRFGYWDEINYFGEKTLSYSNLYRFALLHFFSAHISPYINFNILCYSYYTCAILRFTIPQISCYTLLTNLDLCQLSEHIPKAGSLIACGMEVF